MAVSPSMVVVTCLASMRKLPAGVSKRSGAPRLVRRPDEMSVANTGRGPSSEALHLGHLVPFHFTAWLQAAFKAPLVIQLTDDEKFLWKDLTLGECARLARENARDIVACGFAPERTFIFTDTGYIGALYPNVLRVQTLQTIRTAKDVTGVPIDREGAEAGA